MQNSEEIESLKDSGKKKKSYKKIKEKNNYNNCVFFIYLLIISFTFIYIIIIIQIKFSSHKKEEYINHKLTYNITPIDPDIPKHKIKVKYVDFWPSFKIENFDIHHILQERYEVIISDKPEYVFFGEFGHFFGHVGIEDGGHGRREILAFGGEIADGVFEAHAHGADGGLLVKGAFEGPVDGTHGGIAFADPVAGIQTVHNAVDRVDDDQQHLVREQTEKQSGQKLSVRQIRLQ